MASLLDSTLEAIRYKRGQLEILDQQLLPQQIKYIPVQDTDSGWNVIRKMQVRGAPAIAIVGALSLAVEMHGHQFNSPEDLCKYVSEKFHHLITARPTAVNIMEAAEHLKNFSNHLAESNSITTEDLKERVIVEIERMLEDDIATNKKMGKYGADHILQHYNNTPVRILTHCNAGALATAGFGTALGVVRNLYQRHKLLHIYCTETRPYNQGSRLTAFELVHDKMPATLICDSMAAFAMAKRGISAVVVGADRVVMNGDTANKIGTYQLAIGAKHHNIPFYVACPTTTFDPKHDKGDDIIIEERPHEEMTAIHGIDIAAPGIMCWNPAFDVTPAELITGGIITEYGVFKPSEMKEKVAQIATEYLES